LDKINQVGDMPIYQSFLQLAIDLEKATRDFGPDFRWLRVQCLRSSESVCANLTEGFYSQYSTEYIQCLYRCRREARETMCHLEYAVLVGRLGGEAGGEFAKRYQQSLIQLAHLTRSVEHKLEQHGKSKPPSSLRESAVRYSVSSDDDGSGGEAARTSDDLPTI
jgi:four helix bundle protein